MFIVIYEKSCCGSIKIFQRWGLDFFTLASCHSSSTLSFTQCFLDGGLLKSNFEAVYQNNRFSFDSIDLVD